MTVADLERLYDCGYWANAKLFAVMQTLTPDEFTRPVAGSYGSIRNTLVHVLSAEWGWMERCGGPARGARLNPDWYPTLDTLRATWTTVEAHMRAFLASLSDADLARPIEFSIDGTTRHVMLLGGMMQHAAIHAVHHRGQVTLLLRMMGHVPGNIDLLFFDAGRLGMPAP